MPNMSLKLTQYELINFIDNAYLPGVTVGVGITTKPLKEDEILAGRCVLLVKGYGVVDSVSIYKWH